jgi:hypothetical protein
MSAVTIDEIALAAGPDRWSACGFSLSDRTCQLGAVRLRFDDAEGRRQAGEAQSPTVAPTGAGGIVSWSLRGISSAELDGLATTVSARPVPAYAPVHPNGVVAIDHVVAMSAQLDRTVAALAAAGLDLRRVREEPTPAGAPRQAFFRLGEVILEVVQEPAEVLERAGGPDRPARLWGLALVFSDLEGAVGRLGEHASPVRPAVQPGRQISTLRRTAGLSVPVALMSGAESVGTTT